MAAILHEEPYQFSASGYSDASQNGVGGGQKPLLAGELSPARGNLGRRNSQAALFDGAQQQFHDHERAASRRGRSRPPKAGRDRPADRRLILPRFGVEEVSR